jgi:hypothetical protein
VAGLSQSFLDSLAKDLSVERAALQAVIDVESSGQPFLPTPSVTPKGADVSGNPVVQFEGHIFWQRLSNLNDPALRPAKLLNAHPDYRDIIYPRLDYRYTLRPLPEWDQLIKARSVHQVAADESASWGAFQVMGFNAKLVGFRDIADFVEAMNSLEGQARAFVGYLKAVPATVKALRALDFAAFAKLYNGPAYARNKYDAKMRARYEVYRK